MRHLKTSDSGVKPRIFQGRQDFWNKDILINILSTTHALRGKIYGVFSLR